MIPYMWPHNMNVHTHVVLYPVDLRPVHIYIQCTYTLDICKNTTTVSSSFDTCKKINTIVTIVHMSCQCMCTPCVTKKKCYLIVPSYRIGAVMDSRNS